MTRKEKEKEIYNFCISHDNCGSCPLIEIDCALYNIEAVDKAYEMMRRSENAKR